MIPKLVHQACRDASALRPELKANIEALERLNPGWTHCLYDNAQMLAYLERHLDADSFALARRIELPGYGAALADLFRYVVCFNEGGVYLDIKSTATRPLDEVLRPDDAYLISQWRNRAHEESPGWGLTFAEQRQWPGGDIEQWQIVCEPRHPFLGAVISAVLQNLRDYSVTKFGTGFGGVLRTTGPICYTSTIHPIVDQHPHRIVDIRELGFLYSIYRPYGSLAYTGEDPRDQSEPLVLAEDAGA
jgi:mannosyltransferase OCH1-like enzyme